MARAVRRYYEDPSIARAAAVVASEVWFKIEAMVRVGSSFYRARETVLAVEMPKVAKSMGKEVASRVVREIHHYGPEHLSGPTKRAQRKLLLRDYLRMTQHRKRFGRLRWYDRLWIRINGVPWRQ